MCDFYSENNILLMLLSKVLYSKNVKPSFEEQAFQSSIPQSAGGDALHGIPRDAFPRGNAKCGCVQQQSAVANRNLCNYVDTNPPSVTFWMSNTSSNKVQGSNYITPMTP